MSEPQPDAPEPEVRSIVPFVAAGVLAVLVLVGIVIAGVLSPAEKNVTEADKLAAAVRNYADARGRSDTVPPPGTACDGFDEAASPLAEQLGGPETRTEIEVAELADPVVQGDRGRITVTTRVDGRVATATWSLTRAGDRWLVCG
ncbi:Rv0361 family membrane protein [Nocardia harenae]|uniref:Rv0361 family membrane protein n=1 Tax=Nocardia harenae TaxID=358707 RepID=UPI000832B380|nr:hypothetical protein [Nocardia harenae]